MKREMLNEFGYSSRGQSTLILEFGFWILRYSGIAMAPYII